MIKEPSGQIDFDQVDTDERQAELGSRVASLLKRLLLGLLALTVILSMLSNLVGLPESANPRLRSDIGLTERQIIARYGPPSARSTIQAFREGSGNNLAPRRLGAGDRYYSLRYEEGPLVIVFHLVSPDTYRRLNSHRVDPGEWVVIERLIGADNVIY